MMEDLREECEKCGAIVDIRIPKPDAGVAAAAVAGTGCYGKVFVLMDDAAAARRLRDMVHGRVYDGRTLEVSYVHEGHFYQLPLPQQV